MRGVVYLDVFGGEGLPFHYCKVELGPEIVDRIRSLSESVKKLDIWAAVLFDNRVEPLKCEYLDVGDPTDVRVDVVCMNVTGDYVYWSGNIKHGDCGWDTGSIPVARLQEALDTGLDLRQDYCSVANPPRLGHN